MLFAIVHLEDPSRIVEEIGAPFEAESLAEAKVEVINTYGIPQSEPEPLIVEAHLAFGLQPPQPEPTIPWLAVPLTPELKAQYPEAE